MIVVEMKCGMCGRRFEIDLVDRQDPDERDVAVSRRDAPIAIA